MIGLGRGAVSERPTGLTSPGSSELSLPRSIRSAADRAADHRGDDEAEGGHGDAGLGRAGEAAGGELGRPGDDGAVAAEQRGRAEDHAEAHRQAGDPGAEAADEVLQDQEHRGDEDEDAERPAALEEVGDAGVEADAGEEHQEQQVARVGVEADLGDAETLEREEAEGDEEAAGDRVGDVEAAQHRDAVVDGLAEEVGDEAEGDRDEVGELELGHGVHASLGGYSKRALSWRQR